MKRIISLILAIACIGSVLAFAVSCGDDFDAKEWAENNEKTKRSATYKELNDEKYYEIDVDGKITMNINVNTVSGDAFFAEIYNSKTPNSPVYSLVIHKKDGAYFAKTNKAGAENEIALTADFGDSISIAGEDAEYVIHIKGQNHTGSFTFDW